MFKLRIVEIKNPETLAMLQALYSRSHESVDVHLKDIDLSNSKETDAEKKLKEKMHKFYIGYGHDSIGDCGTTTLFIENVSIIAAKAIQESNLYNGQETSTRYIDFINKKEDLFILLQKYHYQFYIHNENEIKNILHSLYGLYNLVKNQVFDEEVIKHLQNNGSLSAAYRRAINAFSFDVARGFLPAGSTTQLSFHGTLRNIRRHFLHLKTHPFPEVRNIATYVLNSLSMMYPNSFKSDDGIINNNDIIPHNYYYNISNAFNEGVEILNQDGTTNQLQYVLPNYEKIHYFHNESSLYGNIKISHKVLDYGSWRDLQRHRNGFCRPTIPFPISFELENIMHRWYSHYLKDQQKYYLNEILRKIEKLSYNLKNEDKGIISYFMPLGTIINTELCYNAQELDYIFNLRLRDTVHPTLTSYLSDVCEEVVKAIPYFDKYKNQIQLLKNREVSLKRGHQTILKDNQEI